MCKIESGERVGFKVLLRDKNPRSEYLQKKIWILFFYRGWKHNWKRNFILFLLKETK